MKVWFIFCLVPFFYQSASANTYEIFQENGKVGVKNASGKVLIPAQYDELGWSNGDFSVLKNVTGYRSGEMWGLINLENNRLTKAEFESLAPGDQSLIVGRKKTRTSVRPFVGCVNLAGKEVIPFIYDGLEINGLRAVVFTRVGNDFRYGVIDLTNKTIIPQQYQDVRPIGTLRFAVKNFGGKTALFSDAGKQITEFSIDSISAFSGRYAVIYEGRLKGLISRDGEIVVNTMYRDIENVGNGRFKVREPDEWVFLDQDNNTVRLTKADSVSAVATNVYKVKTDNVSELTDQNFLRISEIQCASIGKFVKGLAEFTRGAEKGVLSDQGKVILPAQFSDVAIHDGFIIAKKSHEGSNVMLFNLAGTRLGNRTYEGLTKFSNVYSGVFRGGYWGVLNDLGEEVLPCVYDSLLAFRDDLFVVRYKGLHGIVNVKDEWILSPRANRIQLLGGDRLFEFNGDVTHLKTIRGSTIYFSSNSLIVQNGYIIEILPTGEKWKISLDGVILDRNYVEPRSVVPGLPAQVNLPGNEGTTSEGLTVIRKNGRYGFVDAKGRLRIANRYEAVQPFREGFAAVKILGKWGFINMQDNLVVQPVYEEVWPFEKGIAMVKQKGLYGIIDTHGKLLLPIRYQEIRPFPSSRLLVVMNNLKGLADPSGNILITPRYDDLRDVDGNSVIVKRDNQYGVVNYNGVATIPLTFDFMDYDPFKKLFLAHRKSEWKEIEVR